ncbi:MAG: hypothetical protein ACLUVG_23260 [Phocaeicola vulgatus]
MSKFQAEEVVVTFDSIKIHFSLASISILSSLLANDTPLSPKVFLGSSLKTTYYSLELGIVFISVLNLAVCSVMICQKCISVFALLVAT